MFFHEVRIRHGSLETAKLVTSKTIQLSLPLAAIHVLMRWRQWLESYEQAYKRGEQVLRTKVSKVRSTPNETRNDKRVEKVKLQVADAKSTI